MATKASNPESCLGILARRWSKLQISHRGGKYSIERMLALSNYTKTTSLWRVLLVCIATPLPMIAVVLLQELIPLQNPREGWKANHGFWIRFGNLAGTICASIAIHAMHMIDGVAFTMVQIGVLGVVVGASFPFVGMLVAELWVFPVPFVVLLLNTLFVTEIVVVLRLIVGREAFRRILKQRHQCMQFFNFITVQMLLSVVYPAYQVLFGVAANSSYELPVILLLPIIKLLMKNLLSLTIPHLEDMLPLEVIFCVDFFNAFYLVTCVQSASSTSSVITILALDITQSILELYRLHGRTRTIAAKISQAIIQGNAETSMLLRLVQTVCENPDNLASHLPHDIRVRSNSVLRTQRNSWLVNVEKRRESRPELSQLSPDSSMITSRLLQDQSVFQTLVKTCTSRVRSTIQPISTVQMVVKPPRTEQAPTRTVQPSDTKLAENTPSFLSEALEVLFTSECLVLTEYLEAIIPVVYGCYVKVLVNLPSAQYHIELEGTTDANVDSRVQSVFVYASLEFVSLAVLVLVMWRNCGLKALYQLAFVLETQMKVAQCKLIVWALITLCFRVVHFGVDFTFQFAWVQEHSA